MIIVLFLFHSFFFFFTSSRPQKVCLCPFLPAQPINVSMSLYIVQHPAEVSEGMGTCHIVKSGVLGKD